MAKKSIQEALSLPVFAEKGNRTPFTNQQHAEGWETVGATPPEATQFNDVFQTIDVIARWAFDQIVTAIRDSKKDFQPNDLEKTNLSDLIKTAIGSIDFSNLVTLDTEQNITGKKTFKEVWGNGGKLGTEAWTNQNFYKKGDNLILKNGGLEGIFSINEIDGRAVGLNYNFNGDYGYWLYQAKDKNWYIGSNKIVTENIINDLKSDIAQRTKNVDGVLNWLESDIKNQKSTFEQRKKDVDGVLNWHESEIKSRVKNIRIGKTIWDVAGNAVARQWAGHVITGINIAGQVDWDADYYGHAPIQYEINGQWKNSWQE